MHSTHALKTHLVRAPLVRGEGGGACGDDEGIHPRNGSSQPCVSMKGQQQERGKESKGGSVCWGKSPGAREVLERPREGREKADEGSEDGSEEGKQGRGEQASISGLGFMR